MRRAQSPSSKAIRLACSRSDPPLAPASVSAPGLRLSMVPTARTDARLTWSAAYLASATDRWIAAGLQDPSGQSGRFLGHALDARARLWNPSQRVTAEVGARFSSTADSPGRSPAVPIPGADSSGIRR